jgi:hypothetical protein
MGSKKSAESRRGYNPQTGTPTGEAVGDLERLEQLRAEFMAQGMSAHAKPLRGTESADREVPVSLT